MGGRHDPGDELVEDAYALDQNTLVGREDSVLDVLGVLSDGDARLLTVVGQSGVGKTRLVQEVARRRVAPGTPVMVPLASVRDAALISDAVVDALPEHGGLRTRAVDALWSCFDGEPVLLVLDNLEQIAGAAEVVRELLGGYPELRILATSLRPLDVAHERVLRLRPFGTVVREDGSDPALQLFIARARAADAAFRGEEQVEDIADLCDQVGGLPLAIELAAARCGSLTPRLILDQLRAGSGIELLRDVSVGRDLRHTSVSAAIEWSYLLLEPGAQAAFRMASVFEAPFRLDAAHAVLDPAADPADVLDLLSELVDVQLLELQVEVDGSARFAMPPLMRTYALGRLGAAQDAECRDRHSRWFRARCSADAENVGHEWPDVVAALDTAVRRGDVGEALLAAVEATSALTDAPGASAMLRSRMDDLVQSGEEIDPALATRALVWGTKQPPDRRGDLESVGRWTSERLARALTLARASGDPAAVLAVLDLVVSTMPTTLDVAGAVAATQEGLALAARGTDPAMRARFEMYAAVIARQSGDVPTAVGLAVEALERARGCGADAVATGSALILLGLPEQARPVLDPPLPSPRTLLADAEAGGQRREAVIVLTTLTSHALAAGRADVAAAYVHRALELGADVETTDPFLSLSPVPMLLLVALAAGDADSAARVWASLTQVEPMLRPVLPPDLWVPYDAAVATLRASIPDDVLTGLEKQLGGLTLPQVNRNAQSIARHVAGAALAATFPRPAPSPEPSPVAAAVQLTPRQREVLVALASGRTYKEIGAELGMSAKTVMHHSAEIYRRLDVRGRGEATAWAFRHGMAPGLRAGD